MSGTRRKPGPLGPFVGGYRSRLLSMGYRPSTVVGLLKALGQMGRWMQSEALAPAQLDEARIEEFLAARREAGVGRVPDRRGLIVLLEYLRDERVIAGVVVAPPSAVESLLGTYRDWLVNDRGLAEATVLRYGNLARRFLLSRADGDSVDVQGLTGNDVTTFLLAECARVSLGSAKGRVAELRSLLRFLHVRGLTRLALGAAVPPVAGWRDAGLPLTVSASDVQALLDSCDRRGPVGVRDFAIVTLVARLGLRSAEVARLQLGDVDWRAGEIVIRGKARRTDRLPLPVEVGQALADYLAGSRPSTPRREVFWTCRAPRRPIRPDLVSDVMRRACRRTGRQPFGAHRLRHALATELLAKGAPLVDISQVLRHRDLATTAIYAKVDIGALRALAQPWPGGSR